MKSKKSHIISLVIALIGVFVGLLVLTYFINNILEELPILTRIIAMIFSQWVLMVVPIILMIFYKEKAKDIGLQYDNFKRQMLIGITTGLVMSFFFTLLPYFLGYEQIVGDSSYTKIWQVIYYFIYTLIGVAIAEEIIFRGYLFYKLEKITNSQWSAIILSSIIFGLFHGFTGGFGQVIITAVLGLVLCIVKVKFAHNSLVAPIIAHGIYNGLIVLFGLIL